MGADLPLLTRTNNIIYSLFVESSVTTEDQLHIYGIFFFLCGSQLKAIEALKWYSYDKWRSALIHSYFLSTTYGVRHMRAWFYRILLFYGANIPFDQLLLPTANFNRHSLPVRIKVSLQSNCGYFTIDTHWPTNNIQKKKYKTLKGNLYRKKPHMSGLMSMHQAEEK